MKKISSLRLGFFAAAASLSFAWVPALQAQSTSTTPNNITGAESDSKTPQDSAAQIRNGSTGTGANAASAPERTNTKDTGNSLDKNPSTASSGSADKEATKDPNGAPNDNPNGTRTAADTGKMSNGPARFSEKHFLTKAAEGGMTEVKLGEIAQQKGDSAEVKAFGAHMAADHSKANDELKGLAQQKGVEVPTQLDAKDQANIDRLNALSGPAFDKAYVNDMVTDHKKTVAEFEKASTSSQDADVKAFAEKTLPVLKSHLADIESIQQKLK